MEREGGVLVDRIKQEWNTTESYKTRNTWLGILNELLNELSKTVYFLSVDQQFAFLQLSNDPSIPIFSYFIASDQIWSEGL